MGKLFNQLTIKDKAILRNYITRYAPYARGNCREDMGPLKDVLANWDVNKSDLYKLLGENLIITKHIRNEQDICVIKDNLRIAFDTCGSILNKANRWLWDIGRDHWNELGELHSILSLDNLATGRWSYDECVIHFPDSDKPYKVTRGMRIMRIIARMMKAYPSTIFTDEDYEELRIFCSMQRNQAVLEGELALSIHPMDYITMSDTGNWESCMRWMDGPGDYRQGTVEMMNSSVVVEAYLYNPENELQFAWHKENGTWNVKQWRQLFIVNDTVLAPIKGYPYQSDFLRDTVMDWLRQLAHDNMGWDYPCSTELSGNYIHIENPNENKHDTNIDFQFGYMYCDLGTLNIAPTMYYNIDKLDFDTYYNTIPVSGPSQCMLCGGPLILGDESDEFCEDAASHVTCSKCENFAVCACCGRLLNEDTAIWVDDLDGYICDGCYDENYTTDIFNETHRAEDCINVYLYVGNDKKGNRNPRFYGDIILYNDLPSDTYNKFFKQIRDKIFEYRYIYKSDGYTHKWTEYKYYVTLNDCTEEGLKLFWTNLDEITKYASQEEIDLIF